MFTKQQIVGYATVLTAFYTMMGFWPAVIIIVIGMWYWMRKRPQPPPSDAFGTAKWEDEKTLEEAGMFENAGTIVGRVGERILRLPERFFNHALICGPSGSGKGLLLIANLLLGWKRGSTFVFDPKFENYEITWKWRKRMGQKIVLLDPMGMLGNAGTPFNQLAHIDPNDPRLVDYAKVLANALVIRAPGGDKEAHWNNWAEIILTASISFVLHFAPKEQRNLQVVADLLSDPVSYRGMVNRLQTAGDACGGMLARLGRQIASINEKELSSIKSTCFDHLSFSNSPQIKAHMVCTEEESFDPRELLDGNVTVYFGLPADQLRALNRLSRLEISAILLTFMRAGPNAERQFRMVLDELAELQDLPILQQSVTLMRGYGVKTISFIQALTQLDEVFPEGKSSTFLSNMDAKVFFTPNDYRTAEELSKHLGPKTINLWDDNGGDNWSAGTSMKGNGGPEDRSRNFGGSAGWSRRESARELLKPDEVLQLGSNAEIVFCRHIRPVLAKPVRYYEDPEFIIGAKPIQKKGVSKPKSKFGKAIMAAVVMYVVYWLMT